MTKYKINKQANKLTNKQNEQLNTNFCLVDNSHKIVKFLSIYLIKIKIDFFKS